MHQSPNLHQAYAPPPLLSPAQDLQELGNPVVMLRLIDKPEGRKKGLLTTLMPLLKSPYFPSSPNLAVLALLLSLGSWPHL